MAQVSILSDEWLSRYGLLENFNASVTRTRTGTGTWKTIALRGWVRKFCHRCYNFVNRHDRLLYYTLIERATFLLYNDAKRMHERNKYFKLEALKDTWGKTNSTFS